MKVWEKFLTETDQRVLNLGIHGRLRGLADNPALVVVDAQYRFLGDNKPIIEQLADWPGGCGESGYKALKNIKTLTDATRQTSIPIIYTTSQYVADSRFQVFGKGKKDDSTKETKGVQIAEEITPRSQDIVVPKRTPSAFFATPLITYLTKLRIDSLIVTGGTTSGCVRALVVDAMSYLFRVAVVEDCVFDRFEFSHAAALFDMWSKYCDIIGLQGAVDYLKAHG